MLLAFLPAALALDVDVRLTAPSGATASVTFHDVERQAPPSFTMNDGGLPLRVTVGVEPSGDRWTVSAEIARVKPGLWRERVETLLAPRVTLETNSRGIVKQGASVPIAGTDPVQFVDHEWTLDIQVRTP